MNKKLTLDNPIFIPHQERLGFHIDSNVTIGRVKNLLDGSMELDFDVFLPTINENLQRELCWTGWQKSAYLLSIFKGLKISNLAIVKMDNGNNTIFQVIDGKQRLNTIINFVLGKEIIYMDGGGYTWSDLDTAVKNKFNNLFIESHLAYAYYNDEISDKQKLDWFEDLSFLGTVQDTQHLYNLKKKVDKLSEKNVAIINTLNGRGN
jgi:uncharacterized protein with ParB-like and HNH nuclease domain